MADALNRATTNIDAPSGVIKLVFDIRNALTVSIKLNAALPELDTTPHQHLKKIFRL